MTSIATTTAAPTTSVARRPMPHHDPRVITDPKPRAHTTSPAHDVATAVKRLEDLSRYRQYQLKKLSAAIAQAAAGAEHTSSSDDTMARNIALRHGSGRRMPGSQMNEHAKATAWETLADVSERLGKANTAGQRKASAVWLRP